MSTLSTETPWRPRAIVFDLLTALLDSWSLWDACTPSESPTEGRRWRARYLELTFGTGAYTPYEDLVAQAASDVGLPSSASEALLQNWENLEPWPEVASILQTLKSRGYKLGVVTNCSKHLGHIAVRQVEEPAGAGTKKPFAFDAAITAEESGFYKPVDLAYKSILPMLGVKASEVLFVAGSAGDVQGATDAGMRVVWHNKIGLGKKGDAVPLCEGKTLDDALRDYVEVARSET
ncbi:HAD-like domain-containing protein [Thelonectria olida]|uniref:HAD-like domain-containing protein n=1 Tax=Thelonectria olida TaxID=1576542 RepID=A0A9P8W1C7_9HYPO|nr:HAD-like domain-containing protein [Thelonectria olida]